MKRLIAACAAVLTVTLFGGTGTTQPHRAPGTAFHHSSKTGVRSPIAFEPNVGQADPAIQFVAHGGEPVVSLTSTGATLSFGAARASDLLGMTYVGADRRVRANPSDRLSGVSNYFIGNDPSTWLTNVPQYGRVTYRNLYPGIDLSFYGNRSGRLEYDFTVAPGADPSRVELTLTGQRSLALDASGNLTLDMGGHSMTQRRPLIYQSAGDARRVIAGGFALKGNGVSFTVGPFDRTIPLVIDPEVEYSTYLGGSGDELADAEMAVDKAGHAFVCGDTDSPNFPVTPGAYQPALKVGFDAFVTEMNSDGSGLVYSTYLGGSGTYDLGISCALDQWGDLYLVGVTNSDDFPTTPGVIQGRFNGGDGSLCFDSYTFDPSPCDGFAVKLSPGGTNLIYSTYLGGTADDQLQGVQVDRSGYAFVAGTSTSLDFPTSADAYQTSEAGGVDEVIAKLDRTASHLLYSTYLGGADDDGGAEPGLAIDGRGAAYIVGGTASTDFPVTEGAFQPRYAGAVDAFATKLDPSGSRLAYSTYLGGSNSDGGGGVAVDSSGNAYISGATCSTDFPVTPHAFQTSNSSKGPACYESFTNDLGEGFVTKLDPGGSSLVFSTYLGGTGPDLPAFNPHVDRSGHVFVGGVVASVDFPVTRNAFQRTNHGGVNESDGTITEFSRDGSRLLFSTYWGGTGDDATGDQALDGSGNLYVAGCTASLDYPTTKGAFQRKLAGGDGFGFGACSVSPAYDAIVMKISFDHEDQRTRLVPRATMSASQPRSTKVPPRGWWSWISGRGRDSKG
jgi:hypothetical protein